MKPLKIILINCLILSIVVIFNNYSFGQQETQTETTTTEQAQQQEVQDEFEAPEETGEKKKSFFSSFKSFFTRKEKQEETPVEEKEVTKTTETSPTKELREKHYKELKELKEKQKKEKEELKQKLEEEEKLKKEVKSQAHEEKTKNYRATKAQIKERKKQIWQARWKKRFIEVITNESDPVFIISADVKKGKTDFMRIKDVEFNYWLRVQNQTPKIINSILFIWEREIPFRGSAILRETRVSEPLIPYEKRVIKYNELDSKREGESYKVKVARVKFEDGTEWINPEYKKT